MRKYKESVESAALPALTRDELIQVDKQIASRLESHQIYPEELYTSQEEHSGVKHVNFDLSGDWKHEHLAAKLLMQQAGYSVYDSYVTSDDDDDYYSAHYDFISDEDFKKYSSNLFTPEEQTQLQTMFQESYSPDVLDDLVSQYRDFYSSETHSEIYQEILEKYHDEDLANDVLAALEDGDELYESTKKTGKKLKEGREDYVEMSPEDFAKPLGQLKMEGVWNILVESQNYHFDFYSNDMDPSLWFGNANRQPGDGYNHSFFPGGTSHYATVSWEKGPEGVSPKDLIEQYYPNEKVTSILSNKKKIGLDEAVLHAVCNILKGGYLVKLSHKAQADRDLRHAVAAACQPWAKTRDTYYTDYPNVWDLDDGWSLVEDLAKACVESIKAEKKARAAAKRAAKANPQPPRYW